MVTLAQVQESNARIATTLPAGMVALFIGSTSGIGEFAMKAFAKYAASPKIYFVGRSEEAAVRIIAECKHLNPAAQLIFIKADVSLLETTDEVCEQIKAKETTLNMLFLSQGALVMKDTSEGIPTILALCFHTRLRFITNLTPLLQRATALKRVVSVMAGTKEGPVNTAQWYGSKLRSPIKQRGHPASLITLAHSAAVGKLDAADVSFVHDYPGAIKTGFGREAGKFMNGLMMLGMSLVFRWMSPEECGERHVFLATSAAFPPRDGVVCGVPLAVDVGARKGADGEVGSGSYAVDENGDNASQEGMNFVAGMVKDGTQDKVWDHVEGEFTRVLGLKGKDGD